MYETQIDRWKTEPEGGISKRRMDSQKQEEENEVAHEPEGETGRDGG